MGPNMNPADTLVLLRLMVERTDLSHREKVNVLSVVLSPMFNEFIQNGGLNIVASIVSNAHEKIGSLSDDQYLALSHYIRNEGREKIKDSLTRHFADASYEKALAEIVTERTMVMPQAEQIALLQFLKDIAPPKMKAFLEEADGMTNKPVADIIEDRRVELATKTNETLAQEKLDKIRQFPIDEITKLVNTVTGRMTPRVIESLMESFALAVTPYEAAELAKHGVVALQDTINGVVAGRMPIEILQDSKAGKAFKQNLKNVLAVLEEIVQETGILPDMTNLKKKLAEISRIKGPSV